MFNRHNVHPPEDNENDTESWSFPSQFQRFSVANLPKSRLGKRRTKEEVDDGKKGLPRGVPALHDNRLNTDPEEFKNSFSQSSSFTHPITPNRANGNKLDKYALESESSQSNEYVNRDNFDSFTPFRNDRFRPLQEIDNLLGYQQLNVHLEKNNPSTLSSHGDLPRENNSKLDQMLKNTFEDNQCFMTDEVLYQNDCSNFDIGNNSSFMTAQDPWSLNRSKGQLELKTPCKDFNLLDVLSSPINNNISANNQSENLKKILSTPKFTCFDSFKTPFKSKVSPVEHTNEICTTTLLNLAKTPRIKLNELKNDFVTGLDNSQISLSFASGTIITSPNKSTSEVDGNHVLSESSHLTESPSSVEDKMKTEIFEGLGWTELSISLKNQSLNVASVDISKDSNPECSSVLLTPNNSRSDSLNPGIDEFNMNSEMNSRLTLQNTESKEQQGFIKINRTCQDPTVDPSLSSYHAPYVSNNHTFKEANSGYNSNINLEPSEKVTQLAIKREESPDKVALDSTTPCEKAKNTSCVSLEMSSTGTVAQTTVVTMKTNDVIENRIEKKNFGNKTVAKEENQNSKQNVLQESRVSCNTTCSNESVSVKSVPHPIVTPLQPIFDYQRHVNQQSNVVFVNNKPYTVLSLLGKGGSSEVYQVLDCEHSKLMAMKSVNLAMVEDIIATGYLNEIEVLSKLQGCPTVIRMFDNEYIADKKILYVVMEKGDTDFSRLMKDIMKTKEISTSMILYYWTEMLNCVKDIHEKGIIHSDLKPANFLLVSGRLKLIDFGIASSLQGDMTSVLKDVTTGTFNYMSPEAIRNNGDSKGYKITYKSDIWSLGCILYNLLYGRTPFSHLTSTWVKLSTIADPGKDVTFPRNSSAPPNLIYSVRWALRKDPRERPTAKDLLKLAELTPGPETRLGRQISSLLSEYIHQTFPECRVTVNSNENKEDKNS